MANTSDELQIDSQELSSPEESLRELRKQRTTRKAQEETRPQSGLRDVLGMILVILSLALAVALVSHDPSDPSSFHVETSKMAANNQLGVIGANFAAFSLQIFGFCAYLSPLATIYFSFICFRNRRSKDWLLHLGCGISLLFVLITFLGNFPPIIREHSTLIPGGLLGIHLWKFISGYLNTFGTFLFLFAFAVLTILVTTQLTVRDFMRWGLNAWRLIARLFYSAWTWFRETRESRDKSIVQKRIITRELRKMGALEGDKEEDSDEAALSEVETPKRRGPGVASAKTQARRPELEDFEDFEDLAEGPASDREDQDWSDEEYGDEEAPPRAAPARGEKRSFPQPHEAPEDFGIKVNKMKNVPAAKQEAFDFVKDMETEWTYPSPFLFLKPSSEHKVDKQELRDKAALLNEKFQEFSVNGEMREIHPGPVVTTYEFKPEAGIKYSKVVGLTDDLCLALGAEAIRIDRMPGKSSIGIEVPNDKRELITFREMIESEEWRKEKSKLLLTLGKTIDGTPYYADLAKMPHLLIAGQTGSGKSVGINAMICSIMMRARPDEVKMIMIDPKMVEMGIYADIPHLLTPVVVDPNEASNALKWAVVEMEYRYRLLAALNFRNLEQYNQGVRSGGVPEINGQPASTLPLIVVLIDELADLMMVARGEVEESIARLAQKSRAIGIHLILATQRPSVDIITGVIKSNLPSRLSYRVSQRNDSRIILDSNGAEKLLGKGDGLFLGPGTSRLVRVHAPYLSESEVLDLVKFLKNQGQPEYNHAILRPSGDENAAEADEESASGGKSASKSGAKAPEAAADPMYEKAARLVIRSGQASVSYLQRKMGLGYGRAAKLVDQMEKDGLVGPNQGSKPRDILVPTDYFDGVDGQMR